MKEIELKFRLEHQGQGDRILEDDFVKKYIVSGTEEDLRMEAIYYDTPDRSLGRRKAAYRVRKENEDYVATLKWSSGGKEGLSVRNECNVEVESATPDLSVFRNDIDDFEIVRLLSETELAPILTTRFLRRKAAMEFENTVVELAVDVGEILAGGKSAPISELEIELISGKTEALISLGKQFQQRFGLKPEEKSKIRRGLELMEGLK